MRSVMYYGLDRFESITLFYHYFDYRENRHYFIKFAVCEFLNFVNVFGQIYFLNFFFGGMFSTYGSDVLSMSNEDPELRSDPLNDVFPKVPASLLILQLIVGAVGGVKCTEKIRP